MENFFTSSAVIQDKNARSLSFAVTTDSFHVTPEIIKDLISTSEAHGHCNTRLCLHQKPDARFHDMIIVEYADKFYRPHKHLHKEETCQIIEGHLVVITFRDDGTVLQQYVLGAESGIVSRINSNQWHVVLPLSDYVVYHESKLGPYEFENDSIFPEWAPDGSDSAKASAYNNNLRSIVHQSL